jgi:hypothetical protein
MNTANATGTTLVADEPSGDRSTIHVAVGQELVIRCLCALLASSVSLCPVGCGSSCVRCNSVGPAACPATRFLQHASFNSSTRFLQQYGPRASFNMISARGTDWPTSKLHGHMLAAHEGQHASCQHARHGHHHSNLQHAVYPSIAIPAAVTAPHRLLLPCGHLISSYTLCCLPCTCLGSC